MRRTRLKLAGATWILLVASSFYGILRYDSQPGEMSPSHSQWPASASVRPKAGVFNLVVAIHPHCPCSRATLSELARLLRDCPDNVETQILLWAPDSHDVDWGATHVRDLAQQLPHCSICIDEEGHDAELFGAKTSGQVNLWSPRGALLFQGGITSSRGHEGDNPGRTALRALIRGESTTFTTTTVFGCSLITPSPRSEP